MIRHPSTNPNFIYLMWLGVALALTAALVYLMIAWRFLGVGNLDVATEGGSIIYMAAACYLIGALLILVRNRWLWISGALINALVMLFYFRLYAARPEVLLSPGGLVSKAAQLVLEVILIYLIVSDWRKSRQPQPLKK